MSVRPKKQPRKKAQPKNRLLKNPRKNGVSIYVHFPYCLYKCSYCDFNSFATSEAKIPFEKYAQTLLHELELRAPEFQSAVDAKTVFLGGGTPSLMPPQAVATLLQAINRHFPLTSETEITLEANPKTVDAQKINGFVSAGVNRISLGVQSLHEKYLKTYGRIHTAADAVKNMEALASSKLKSWNADLMFGFPGQTVAEWMGTLEKVVDLNPPHLSCYAFTVEDEAPYGKMVRQGRAPKPDQDAQAEMFETTELYLKKAGLARYEISNFARPGFESRHNLAYWNYDPYLALGAGAHGFVHSEESPWMGYRTENIKNPSLYMKALANGQTWFTREDISEATAQFELMMMGLRLKAGVEEEKFIRLFGKSVEKEYGSVLQSFRHQKWMKEKGVALTRKGFLHSNRITTAFFDPSP